MNGREIMNVRDPYSGEMTKVEVIPNLMLFPVRRVTGEFFVVVSGTGATRKISEVSRNMRLRLFARFRGLVPDLL